MTNDLMLGGVYILMAVMLVIGSLMHRREPAAKMITMALAWIAIFGAGFVLFTFRDNFGWVAQRLKAEAVGTPVVEMVRLHPYQYTQFNSLAGGIRAAEEHYMLDYWGLAFKQATQELRTKLEQQSWNRTKRGPWRVAVCGPNLPAAVELEMMPRRSGDASSVV